MQPQNVRGKRNKAKNEAQLKQIKRKITVLTMPNGWANRTKEKKISAEVLENWGTLCNYLNIANSNGNTSHWA